MISMPLQYKDNEKSWKCIDHKRSLLWKLCLYCNRNSIIMMTSHMQLFSACIVFASNYYYWSDKPSLHASISVHFHQDLIDRHAGRFGLKYRESRNEIIFGPFMLFNTHYVPTSRSAFPWLHFYALPWAHFYALPGAHVYALPVAHFYALPTAHFYALPTAHFYALLATHFYALQPHLNICTCTFTYLRTPTHFHQRTSTHLHERTFTHFQQRTFTHSTSFTYLHPCTHFQRTSSALPAHFYVSYALICTPN